MRVNHNIASMQGQGALFNNNRAISKNLEKLSTGLRVNRASDDAAGLAISEKMRTQVKGTAQAKKNAMDGISALNIAEGAANEISSILQRMRELSVQSSTDTLTDTDRGYTNQEFEQLTEEIDRITTVTKFNGKSLIDTAAGSARLGGLGGVATGGSALWIDANATVGADSLTITIDTLSTNDLGTSAAVATATSLGAAGIGSQTGAVDAIIVIDEAIGSVNAMRADVGSFVNRLESTINNLTVSNVNQQAAESQIRDVDFASESAAFSKNQILSQASTSMLAQANQRSQGVMSLIG